MAPARGLMFGALPVGPPPAARPRPAPCRRCARAATRPGRHAPPTTSPVWPATDGEADAGGRGLRRHAVEPAVRRADAARPLPGAVRRHDARAACAGRPGARSAQPLDFYGVNYYNPIGVAGRRRGRGPALRVHARSPATRRPTSAGRSCPTSMTRPAGRAEARATPASRRSSSPRTACSYGMGPDDDGRGRRPAADRLPRRPPARRRRRGAAGASTCGATTAGRCWTTSSGPTGFTQRFGLVHVDFETQVRTPKRSFDWYADVIRRPRSAGRA